MTLAAGTPSLAGPWVGRLEAVRERLRVLASEDSEAGALTEADSDTGERWERGQVWAHLAEFPDYWTRQVHAALATDGDEPPPFGRVRTDKTRIDAIEADRETPTADLWSRIEPQLDRLREEIQGFSPEDWQLRVKHSTLGVMDMPAILERFLVGHLEEHAVQLDGLRRS